MLTMADYCAPYTPTAHHFFLFAYIYTSDEAYIILHSAYKKHEILELLFYSLLWQLLL